MFVGRESELERVHALLATAADPTADQQVCFLDGPIGIGKTALLHQVRRRPGGPRVLQARPGEFESGVPLAGLRTVLEPLTGLRLDRVLDDEALVGNVADRCAAALEAEPTLIIVDDAHWLDEASVRLLEHLIVNPGRTWRGYLLAHRPGRLPGRLQRAAARSGARVDRIRLAPLPDPAARRLVPALPDQARDRVLAVASGNPLFLRLLSEVADRPADEAGDDPRTAWFEVQGWSLDDTLRGEIAALPERPRLVLESAAVIGEPDLTRLITVSELAGDEVVAALDDLQGRELIVDTETGRQISHPLIRAAAYRGTSPAWRRGAHRRAATTYGPDETLDQVRHLHPLRGFATPAEVASIVAGARLILAGSPQTAVRWLRGTRHVDSTERDVLLARALVVCGESAAAERLLRPMLRGTDTNPEILMLTMYCLRMLGRIDEARDLIDVGLKITEPGLQIEIATLTVMLDDHRSAQTVTRLVGDQSQPPPIRTAAAWLTSLDLLRTGRIAPARRYYADAVERAARLTQDDLIIIIDAVAVAGWAGFCLEDYPATVDLLERAIRAAHRSGRVQAIAHLQTVLAYHLVQLGRLAEADRAAAEAIEAARTFEWPDTVRMAIGASVHSALWQGDQQLLRERWTTLRDAGVPTAGWYRRSIRSLLHKVGDQLGEDTGHQTVDDHPDATVAVRYLDAGYVALRRRELTEAAQYAAEARSHAAAEGQEAQASLLESRVAAARGDWATASSLADHAVRKLTGRPVPLHLKLAQSWQRECRTRQGIQDLTPREFEVARLVADGRTNRQIAAELHISPRTAEDHVARILRKRGLPNRAALGRNLNPG